MSASMSLATFSAWDIYVFQRMWSGYATAHRLLNSVEATRRRAAAFPVPPTVVVTETTVDARNVNDELRDQLVGGEIDLLCLFSEREDYWIWKRFSCTSNLSNASCCQHSDMSCATMFILMTM